MSRSYISSPPWHLLVDVVTALLYYYLYVEYRAVETPTGLLLSETLQLSCTGETNRVFLTSGILY
jgi:hypothetical protein